MNTYLFDTGRPTPPSTKIVTIASQKGGVGKTTLTMLTATHLYAIGKNVVVIDADNPQHSLYKMRHKELNDLHNDLALREAYEAKGLSPYQIIESSIAEAGKVIPVIKNSGQYDYVLIDLPGTLNVAGMGELAAQIDRLIIPMEMDHKTFASGFETVTFYQHINKLTKIGLVWNRIKTSESKIFMSEINRYAADVATIHVFNTVFYDRVSLKRASSTLFPSEDQYVVNFVGELAGDDGFLTN